MSEPIQSPVINGYVHPTSNNYTKKSVYKTFTAEEKKDEYAFGLTTAGKAYARQGSVEEDSCPVCNGSIVKTCYCIHSDKTCSQGHFWYTNRDGLVKVGNPHTK